MRSFILSVEIWRAFLDVYLHRYGDSKPKPMKQVLVTLADSLSRWPNPEQAQVLRKGVLATFLFWINCHDYTPSLKPALQGLEYFVYKGIFSVREVVVSLHGIVPTVASPPVEDLTTQITGAARSAASPSVPEFPAPESEVSPEDLIEPFISTLLAWTSHTDVAMSASRLILTFFKLLRMQSAMGIYFYHSITKLPLWVSPLKEILERKPEIVDALKHHVLPGLFMLSPEDLRDFISSLNLEHCLSGMVPAENKSEVLLLLSSLQVAQDLGLVRVTGKLVLMS